MDKIKNMNKKTILIVSAIISIFAIASVFAFYTNMHKIDNAMHTANSEVVLNEIFNENDHWLVGETKQKEVNFENTGEIEQLVRFTVIPKWLEQDSNGDWAEWTEAEDDAVTIGFTDYLAKEWTEIDGYYYYNTTLSPNAQTNIVMENVIFSSDLDNGGYGNSLDYSNKRYSLTVKMEAIEVNEDVALSQWNVACSMNDNKATWSEISTN